MRNTVYVNLFPVLIFSFAIACGVGIAVYIHFGLHMEGTLGDSCSTSSIALVFLPHWIMVFSIGGGVLGAIIALLLRLANRKTISLIGACRLFVFLLAGISLLACGIAFLLIVCM